MLMTTTPTVEGRRIVTYYGVVTGETIIGANVMRDFLAGIRDFFGGRSGLRNGGRFGQHVDGDVQRYGRAHRVETITLSVCL